ncbi:hypothetical protein AVEN_145203-1 [Araneus ventricosus]|uniref:Uncharacterized protein n=1 Tax=Araneus ventricosus TaxID=182803 RepID=A0A4Y2Q3K5_ARAVE|nr:hypothetical protein AVEN_145203-1 [Araneus ventricosus]
MPFHSHEVTDRYVDKRFKESHGGHVSESFAFAFSPSDGTHKEHSPHTHECRVSGLEMLLTKAKQRHHCTMMILCRSELRKEYSKTLGSVAKSPIIIAAKALKKIATPIFTSQLRDRRKH